MQDGVACYFGDYVPLDVRNKWNFCLLSTYNVSIGFCGLFKHSPNNTVNHITQRDHSFKKGALYCGVVSFGSSSYLGQGWSSMTGGVGTAGCRVAGTFYTSPVFIYTNPLDTNILSSGCYMGVIPGVRDPIMTDGENSTVSFTINQIAPITITNADYTDILLYLENNVGNVYHIFPYASSKAIFRVGKGFRNV